MTVHSSFLNLCSSAAFTDVKWLIYKAVTLQGAVYPIPDASTNLALWIQTMRFQTLPLLRIDLPHIPKLLSPEYGLSSPCLTSKKERNSSVFLESTGVGNE